MPDRDPDQLVVSLREAARSVTRERRDVDVVLTDLVAAGVGTVPQADGGGITCTEGRTVRSTHTTNPEIAELGRLQVELGEGPCVGAAADPPTSGIVLADDLEAEPDAARWPRFAPAAARAGYRSLLSVQISRYGRWRSALVLYAAVPRGFDTTSQLTIGLFGLRAATLLHGSDHATGLGRALVARDVLGQAIGILMGRFVVDGDEAFAMLVRAAQDTKTDVVEVARWLVQDVVDCRASLGPSEV